MLDLPVAPPAPIEAPATPDLGLFTWLLHLRRAQWALYFNRYYGDGSLDVTVLHYPTVIATQDPVMTIAAPNTVTGSGSFSLPGPKLSSTFQATSALEEARAPLGNPG